MPGIEDVRQYKEALQCIDWDMTPEEAVRLYLEWGNNWAQGNYVIRSKDDETTYFVVSTWKASPKIYLIRRNSDEAQELAKFELPSRFEKDVCELKGVYALDPDVKRWVQEELGVLR